jgi:hypothetical protein
MYQKLITKIFPFNSVDESVSPSIFFVANSGVLQPCRIFSLSVKGSFDAITFEQSLKHSLWQYTLIEFSVMKNRTNSFIGI